MSFLAGVGGTGVVKCVGCAGLDTGVSTSSAGRVAPPSWAGRVAPRRGTKTTLRKSPPPNFDTKKVSAKVVRRGVFARPVPLRSCKAASRALDRVGVASCRRRAGLPLRSTSQKQQDKHCFCYNNNKKGAGRTTKDFQPRSHAGQRLQIIFCSCRTCGSSTRSKEGWGERCHRK
jgi:hypothetical protein